MKKGFTIIEIIIAISLIGLLVCTEIVVASRYMKTFKESMCESRDSFYANEAFAFIEGIVNEAKYVDVNNNIIKLERKDGTGSDWIRTDKAGNIIISYGSCYFGNINNIMKNTSLFEAKQAGRVMFISITTNKEKKYKRCISINSERAKEDLYWCIHY